MKNKTKTEKVDLSTKIGKLTLKNPILSASGTFGYANEFEKFVNVENIGAIVTKAITLNPREGNPQPRIKEVKQGLINSIGLENIGIYSFIEKKIPLLEEKNITYILNIAGSSEEEYLKLAQICEKQKIQAIELNLSCPNVKKGCLELGRDEQAFTSLLKKFRQIFSGTLIAKLSPNIPDPKKFAQIIKKSDCDAISAINTLKSIYITPRIKDDKFCFSSIKGGLSGPIIKPVALNFINEIKSEVDLPIIGMGGISNLNDIIEFFAIGSNAVQIGTANFTDPYIIQNLVKELQEFLIGNSINSFQDLINIRE